MKRPQKSFESKLEPLSKKVDLSDEGDVPEMEVDEGNQLSVLSEDNTSIDRNLMNEYEKMNPVLAPKAVSMDDEEIMELLNRELPEEPKPEMDETELLATLAAFDKAEAAGSVDSIQSGNGSNVPKTVSPVNFSKEMEETIDRVLSGLQNDSTLDELLTEQTQSKPSLSSSTHSPLTTVDGIPTLQFYLIDVYEDPMTSPGVLYLFGRVAVGDSHETACLIIQNVPHHLYVLPAVAPSGDRYAVNEVKEEMLEILTRFVKSPTEIGFRVDRKRYAFEIENIPTEEVLMFFGMTNIRPIMFM